MQPSKPVALGALALVLVGFALVVTRAQRSSPPAPAAPASAPASAPAPAASTAPPAASAADPTDADPPPPDEFATVGFDTLPDGRKVPPLPDSAPQMVSFGVIQFTYQGAQL